MARSRSFMLVVGLAGVLGLYIAASVVRGILFPLRVAAKPTTAEVAECTSQVRDLLGELVAIATRLQQDAAAGRERDLPERWDDFMRGWNQEWSEVGVRCRFAELAPGTGLQFERSAEIHRNLPKVAAKYKNLMARFTKEQAPELARMRRTLDESLRILGGQ